MAQETQSSHTYNFHLLLQLVTGADGATGGGGPIESSWD